MNEVFYTVVENGIVMSVRKSDKRRYCKCCGIALDVGGGCGVCKLLKTTDIHGKRTDAYWNARHGAES